MENPLRQSLFRAGHAHAGVLVILSLVCQILVDAIILPAPLEWFARLGAPIAAILVPAGFFFSVIPPKAERPNGFISLTYVGAAVLAIGVLILVRITPHKIRLTLEICSTSPSVFKRAYRQPGIRPQSHIPITTYQDVGEVVREVAHVQRQVHG